jgi:hypothetical protein
VTGARSTGSGRAAGLSFRSRCSGVGAEGAPVWVSECPPGRAG